MAVYFPLLHKVVINCDCLRGLQSAMGKPNAGCPQLLSPCSTYKHLHNLKGINPNLVRKNSESVGRDLTEDEIASINGAFPLLDHDGPLEMI
jgi:hypothetical protein